MPAVTAGFAALALLLVAVLLSSRSWKRREPELAAPDASLADVLARISAPPELLPDAKALSSVRLTYEAGAERDEPTGPFALFAIEAGGDSDLGHQRKVNEDAFLLAPDQHLFVVADGIGSRGGGRQASALAAQAVREALERGELDDELDAPAHTPQRARELASALVEANRAVFDAAQLDATVANMGTTLVALRFAPRKQRLYLGHVGDSRCYRLRHGKLVQLTIDHVMSELGVSGPHAGDLYQAIGLEREISMDLLVTKPLPGDLYLLCSDGLSKMLDDDAILQVLNAQVDTESAVYDLIEKANDAGGRDNISVVLARVTAAVPAAQGARA